MLIALGVLLATLAVILVAPAYRRRIARLTTDAIRASVPITEAEIRADKDKLRAQYAIRVHKLEAQGDQQRLAAARQLVEMNRRDARITELDTELERLRSSLEENVNARRVLEHTVTDRLPRLEQQLGSARTLINARDQEMAALKAETTRSVRALDEALQMNAQQRSELERMSSTLTTRTAPNRETPGEQRFDGEIALRSEIEALRTKTRDQALLISRLQPAAPGAANGDASSTDAAMARMHKDLADADAEMKAIRAGAQSAGAASAAETRADALKSSVENQAAEIARLKAALAVYEGEGASKAGSESRVAVKAKVSSLQAQIATQNETIQKLRSELAANNERLARQAAHHQEEMRRLGPGASPGSAEPRRGSAPRRSLSDRINQPAAGAPETPHAPGLTAGLNGSLNGANGASPTSAKVAEYLKALTDDVPVAAAVELAPAAATASSAMPEPATAAVAGPATALSAVAAAVAAVESDGQNDQRKVRLLDRIAGIAKT